jgi:hypothetical protein
VLGLWLKSTLVFINLSMCSNLNLWIIFQVSTLARSLYCCSQLNKEEEFVLAAPVLVVKKNGSVWTCTENVIT